MGQRQWNPVGKRKSLLGVDSEVTVWMFLIQKETYLKEGCTVEHK